MPVQISSVSCACQFFKDDMQYLRHVIGASYRMRLGLISSQAKPFPERRAEVGALIPEHYGFLDFVEHHVSAQQPYRAGETWTGISPPLRIRVR